MERFLKDLPNEQRIAGALAMLDEQADAAVHEAAWEAQTAAWGADWLRPADLRELLSGGTIPATAAASAPAARLAAQTRVLLELAYERMGEGSSAQSQPYEPTRRQREMMFIALAALGPVAGSTTTSATAATAPTMGDADQRLLVRLLASTIACSRRWERDGLQRQLWEAMAPASNLEAQGPMLAKTLDGWVRLHRSPQEPTDGVAAAIEALGHWEPTVRMRAAAFLAHRMSVEWQREGPAPRPGWRSTASRLAPCLDDSRDEVRAAAATAFGLSTAAGPQDLGPTLAHLLLMDPSAQVQQAAATALRARHDLAKPSIDLLLERLAGRLERRRAMYVMEVLAGTVAQASPSQAQRMIELAMDRLPWVSHGAMKLLAALGNQGVLKGEVRTGALAAVRKRQASADRLERQFIDRHVLPAMRRLSTTWPNSQPASEPATAPTSGPASTPSSIPASPPASASSPASTESSKA